MELTREVRLPACQDSAAPDNSWAGGKGDSLRGACWVVRATIRGPVDEQTGYLCDIREIDAAIRDEAAAVTDRLPSDRVPLAVLIRDVFTAVTKHFREPRRLERIEWRVCPQTAFQVRHGEGTIVRITRAFEFCAAHRLACPGWSDEENRRVFGKCSNPLGHGHNYVLEVTLAGAPDPTTGLLIDISTFDRVVRERVLDAFDHRNLNREVAEFTATNPSVENIARAIWGRLHGLFATAQLANVRVWETPKTFADCGGDDVETP